MRPIQSEIRSLNEQDFPAMVNLESEAYPGIKITTEEEKRKLAEKLLEQAKDPSLHFYGAYRENLLVGVMRLHDFSMQCYEAQISTGGVGSIAVDFLHKKEKIARDLILYYMDHYAHLGASMAVLYPFRPDFYRQMGFGYGTKMNRYEIKPQYFPAGKKEHVRRLEKADRELLLACYQRVMPKTHGLIAKGKADLDRLFNPPANHLLGVQIGDEVQGYLMYRFASKRPDNFIHNDMHVYELVYENPAALHELLAFLHSQADQIHDIVLYSQDEDLHHLFSDPRNPSENLFHSISHETNTQGVGLMYRLLDTRKWFELMAGHNFNGQTLTVKFNVQDDLLPHNNSSLLVQFDHGRALLGQEIYDVEVSMDVSDLSSLVMGCVQFRSLLNYGRATISNERFTDAVNRLFIPTRKPICTTEF
jgi:predicted acetyltransferase